MGTSIAATSIMKQHPHLRRALLGGLCLAAVLTAGCANSGLRPTGAGSDWYGDNEATTNPMRGNLPAQGNLGSSTGMGGGGAGPLNGGGGLN